MANIKVIEVLAESNKKWHRPSERAAEEALESLRNIKSFWIQNLKEENVNGKIIRWRLNCSISFEVDEKK